MNAVPHQPSLPTLSLRAIGLDVSCSLSPGIEAHQHSRLFSMKRKAAQKFTVLSATRPEISVLEQTALSIDTDSERERVDGALRTSKGPQKGHGMGSSPLSRLQPAAEQPVLTSSLIAKAVNKSLDEIYAPAVVQSRVAYQGVPGAYSESAARKACPEAEPLPCDQFEVAFQALAQWLADTAVLPIENSLGGSIHTVFDLLIRYRLHIVGEVTVDVRHCLMALPGVTKEDLRRVQSHPQALSQCDNYLRNMKGVVREAVSDTAGAAQAIAQQGLRDVAAIASERAAELYGMNILERNIQDMRDNVTRFIVLSRDPLIALPEDPRIFKTSVVFSLPSRPGEVPGPGQLFKALSVFALRDVDMTKIESRPVREGSSRQFDYLIYLDLVGGMGDHVIQNALRQLQEIAPFLRVLGCYPMYLDGVEAAEGAVEEPHLSSNGASAHGGAAFPDESLMLSAAGVPRRMPKQAKKREASSAPVVAFQGMYGAYSEAVALEAVPGCDPLPCEHFETAFQVLSQWLAENAILPIESSAHGSIHAVYDLLIRYRLHIVGETAAEIQHCLLALPGTKQEDLRRVISDAQALSHCDAFIRGLPGVVKQAVDDTAGAAKMVAENGWRDAAAIGSERAAELYGLEVLARDIQGGPPNMCRFITLAREPLVTSRGGASDFKTSVVFSVPEGPGQLFRALSVFALRELDISKIESRPMRSKPMQPFVGAVSGRRFKYLLYVDFMGNLADDVCQNALRHLEEVTEFMRVLGCYPARKLEGSSAG